MVDIILPIYKPDDKVFEAIDSVLGQTYTNWHLYIVDDASGDDSLEKIKQKYDEHSDKITYFQFEGNKRAAACRNYAIKQGKGEYIAFIDQDDVWMSNKLELQVNYMKFHKVDAIHGNIQFIDNNDNVIMHDKWKKENQSRREVDWRNLTKKELAKKIFIKPNIRLISSMVTRNIFERIEGFKDQFFGGEDELFWFEIALFGKIGFIDETLFRRREHDNNAVKKFKTERLYGYINAIHYIKSIYIEIEEKQINIKLKKILLLLFKHSIMNKKFNLLIYSFKKLISKYPGFIIERFITFLIKKGGGYLKEEKT